MLPPSLEFHFGFNANKKAVLLQFAAEQLFSN